MVKRIRRVIIALTVMLCMLLPIAVGCSNVEIPVGDNPGDTVKPGETPVNTDPTRLDSVVAGSIKVDERASAFVVSWDPVEHAAIYIVKVGDDLTNVSGTTVDLVAARFKLPKTGTITITITAQSVENYKDALPTSITYDMEGAQLSSPKITAFKDNVIEWEAVEDATAYVVKLDGESVYEGTSNSFSAASLTKSGRLEIACKSGDKTGPATAVDYNSETKTLHVLPVQTYTVSGDSLSWSAVTGAVGYKVVDLDFNSYTVKTISYKMTVRNIIYGVYPVMPSSSLIKSAEVAPVDIPYLNGEGTADSPYIIKTPFDLRTIDYYELRYSERGGDKNYYRIDEDMDYRSASTGDERSNMLTLSKPFFGTLDGNGKKLANISVNANAPGYEGGFWALFDYIAKDGTVKDIIFDNPEIVNGIFDAGFPINPAVATVAYNNCGVISGVQIKSAKYKVTGGGIAGIAVHNSGKVTDCQITGSAFTEESTSALGTAAYEVGGIVLENLGGGEVSGCTANNLTISGVGSNIGSAAGIVAINRANGIVKDNSFDGVSVKNIKTGKECGGVVAYTATNTVTQGKGTLGKLTVRSSDITAQTGSTSSPYGKLYGKRG